MRAEAEAHRRRCHGKEPAEVVPFKSVAAWAISRPSGNRATSVFGCKGDIVSGDGDGRF